MIHTNKTCTGNVGEEIVAFKGDINEQERKTYTHKTRCYYYKYAEVQYKTTKGDIEPHSKKSSSLLFSFWSSDFSAFFSLTCTIYVCLARAMQHNKWRIVNYLLLFRRFIVYICFFIWTLHLSMSLLVSRHKYYLFFFDLHIIIIVVQLFMSIYNDNKTCFLLLLLLFYRHTLHRKNNQ